MARLCALIGLVAVAQLLQADQSGAHYTGYIRHVTLNESHFIGLDQGNFLLIIPQTWPWLENSVLHHGQNKYWMYKAREDNSTKVAYRAEVSEAEREFIMSTAARLVAAQPGPGDRYSELRHYLDGRPSQLVWSSGMRVEELERLGEKLFLARQEPYWMVQRVRDPWALEAWLVSLEAMDLRLVYNREDSFEIEVRFMDGYTLQGRKRLLDSVFGEASRQQRQDVTGRLAALLRRLHGLLGGRLD